MSITKAPKLSPKAIEIITEMRRGSKVYKSAIYKSWRMKGISLNSSTIKNLIKKEICIQWADWLELTMYGKVCEI